MYIIYREVIVFAKDSTDRLKATRSDNLGEFYRSLSLEISEEVPRINEYRVYIGDCVRSLASILRTAQLKPHEKCTRLRHRNDLRMSIEFHLVATPSSLPHVNVYASRLCDLRTCRSQGCACTACKTRPAASANLHLDRAAIGLSPGEIAFGGNGRVPVLHFISESGEERSPQDARGHSLSPFLPRKQDLTHRRRRSPGGRIAYELIADSYSACATRRSNLRGVSGSEMNLSKREGLRDIRVSAENSKLADKFSAKIYRVHQNLDNFADKLLRSFPNESTKASRKKISMKITSSSFFGSAKRTFVSFKIGPSRHQILKFASRSSILAFRLPKFCVSSE